MLNLFGLNVSIYEILKVTTHQEMRLTYRIWTYFIINFLFLLPLTANDNLTQQFQVFGNYFPYNVAAFKNWLMSWLRWWVILIFYVVFFTTDILLAVFARRKIAWSWRDALIAALFLFICLFAFKGLTLFGLNPYFGFVSLIFLLLIGISNDSFAFFGGLKWGKTKLAPKISPNKTQAGALIGLLAGTLIAFFFGAILLWANTPDAYLPFVHEIYQRAQWQTYLFLIVIPLALSITSQLGDLLYSACKRLYNVKDFSNLIPGHGGLLDRFDGHSLVLVMMLFLVVLAS